MIEYNPNLTVSRKLRVLEALIREADILEERDRESLAQRLDAISDTDRDGEPVEEYSNDDKEEIRRLYDTYVGGLARKEGRRTP